MTPKKDRALEALSTSRTLAEASQKAGVSVRSIYNWLREDPGFKDAYNMMRSESMQLVADAVSQRTLEAVEVLAEIMRDKNMPATVRVRSAGIILDRYLRLSELVDFDVRISALEEILSQ